MDRDCHGLNLTDLLTILAGFLTALLGALALWLGRKISQRTEERAMKELYLKEETQEVVSHVTFSIAETGITEDSEERVLEQAKKVVDDTLRPVNVVVNFYSENGENIGTLPWLRSDVLGNVSASYPDIQIPPALRYQPVSTDARFSTSRMRRCFKTGLKECPKEIKFSPKMVFVAMPFRPDFQDLYKYAIRPALEDVGFEIWKADEKISNIDVMCKICHGIQECSYVLANISDWNPNVLFEMGLAYGLGKNVVLIKDRKRTVPVDLKGLEYVDYENIDDLRRNITAFFRSVGKSLKGGLRGLG